MNFSVPIIDKYNSIGARGRTSTQVQHTNRVGLRVIHLQSQGKYFHAKQEQHHTEHMQHNK